MEIKSLIAFIVATAVILTIVVTSLPIDKPSKEERAFIEQGEKLYNQLCLSCHGENGKGDGKLPGTALNNQDFLNTFSDRDLYNQIKEGRVAARMPEYGSILDETQINQLVSFIRSWQTESRDLEAPTAFDGNPSNGQKLYGLYCANCHGLTGSGLKNTAPALGNPEFQKYTTDEQIWISAAYGRENTRMSASLKGLNGVRQLEEQELIDIITYIRKDLGVKYNPEESMHQPPQQEKDDINMGK